MSYQPINLKNKLSLFTKRWSPKIIAQLNNYHLKVVKVQGEFVWHDHPETDEVFLVIEGTLEIHLRDSKVTLNAGELYVVPKGVEHKPYAAEECHVLLIEPAGTVNTGNANEGEASEAGIGATEGDWV